jgi:hypothetical protein
MATTTIRLILKLLTLTFVRLARASGAVMPGPGMALMQFIG